MQRSDFFLADHAATEKCGQLLGSMLQPGMVVALDGELGAGKTSFCRGLAVGLAVLQPEQVCSPTFVLLHEYPGPIPLYHFDAYRLRQVEEFWALGASEYLENEGVCVIEWAGKIREALPSDYLQVNLFHLDKGRKISFTPVGKKYEQIVDELKRFAEFVSIS